MKTAMLNRSIVVFVLAALPLLAGCATAGGSAALRAGRYDEAASRFQEALAENPGRLDALVGLGVSKYKLGALDEAVAALDRALAQAPTHLTAHLYLGLSHLQKGDYGPAEEHLGAVAAGRRGGRLAAQIDRALRLTRGADPLSDEMRTFIATSLEDEAEMEREVREAQIAIREAEMRERLLYSPPAYIRYKGRLIPVYR